MNNNNENIQESINFLIAKFNEVKNKWFETKNKYNGNIGNNFEKIIGKENDNLKISDLNGIEIKTKRKNSFNNYITLFNLSPYGKEFFEIKNIKEKYGYPDKDLKNFKVFNGDVFSTKISKIGNKYLFSLFVDRCSKKIYLLVFNERLELIDNSTYWNFANIQESLEYKLQYLALIAVENSFHHNYEKYKFDNLTIMKFTNFECFLKAIEQGFIKVQFKIGIFKSGPRCGQIHDRGTGFQIEQSKLGFIYKNYTHINNIIKIII